MRPTAADYRILALLCVLILNVYLLAYNNAPEDIDGEDTLDVAATWIQHGIPAATRLTTPRLLIVANQDQEFYTLSPDGERYSKKGVTLSLALMPFVFIAEQSPALPIRATAMLINPLVTMMTACLLYIFARRLNASVYAAALLALVFAFATLAFVYVKTLFGEPLAAFLLLAAVYQSYGYAQAGGLPRALVSGAAIGLCIGVNMTYALLTIPIGLYLLWSRRDMRAGLAYAAPVLLMLAFLAYWNVARFGNPLEAGYLIDSGVEGFTTPLHYGLTGLWLSFYKGVFWFQPVLILGFWGLKSAWRHHRALLITCLALIGLHTATYAMWWAWDGAWSWGSRFMLPLIPIMLLATLPALERVFSASRMRFAVAGLMGVSVVIQLPGILYSYVPFYRNVYDGHLFAWENNIVFAAFSGLFGGTPTAAVFAEGGDAVHFAVVLACMGMGVAATCRLRGYARAAVVGSLLVAACLATAARQQEKPGYGAVREWAQFAAGSTVYVQSFEFDNHMLDVSGPRLIVANPHAPEDNALVQRQLERALGQPDDFWLVTWFAPASAENWVERRLWEHYAFAEQRTIHGHRALRFSTASPPVADCAAGYATESGLILQRYGVRQAADGLYLTLEWGIRPASDAANEAWFVHLLDADGNIVSQQDRIPAGGYHPTTTWRTGQPVTDYLYFPTQTAAGWRLRMGFINADTGNPVAFEPSPDAPFLILPLTCDPV